ncbi:MAG: type VI secretion system protein TssA [Bryobacteraceae bacterium]
MATLEELLSPIPGPNPSGENIRYNPAFDKLKEARRPNEDWLAESAGVDYKLVIRQAEDILLKKSKDLQVVVWLIEAYIYREQFEGFHKGLLALKGLIETQWDTVYPELEDGDPGMRLAPLDWLGGSYLDIPLKQIPITKGQHSYLQYHEAQRLGKMPGEDDYGDDVDKKREEIRRAIEDGKVTLDAFEIGFAKTSKQYVVDLLALLDSITATLEELTVVCEEKFQDEPPSFSKLGGSIQEIRLSVNRLLEEKRLLEPDEDAPPAEEEQPSEESSSDDSGGDEYVERAPVARKPAARKRAVTGIEPQDFDDAADRLGAVASWIRSQDLSNPSSYLMLRGYRWGELRASGSSPDYSLLDPPPTETRQQIKKLAMDGYWEDVLRQGEDAMATKAGRGWLDLQRYIVQGLDYQGYGAASAAVKSALKSLLQDMPDLLNMTLTDDTPVANAETMNWIKENILPPPPEPEPVQEESQSYYEPEPEPMPVFRYEAAEGQPEAERPPDAFELAMQAATNGDKEEAIQILMREMLQERSGRGKFQRKMQLAQVCLALGRQGIARPILEELTGEIEKRRLEDWEPSDMVAHTLALYYRSLDGDNEKKQQLYNWICRLDPMQALACAK